MSDIIDIDPNFDRIASRLCAIGHLEKHGAAFRLTQKGVAYIGKNFLNNNKAKIDALLAAKDFKQLGNIIFGYRDSLEFVSIAAKMPQSGHRVLGLLDNGKIQEVWFVKKYGRLSKSEPLHRHGLWKSDKPIVGNVQAWKEKPLTLPKGGES